MRVRAVGYTGGLLVVPVAWRLLGRRTRTRGSSTLPSRCRCSQTPPATPWASTSGPTSTTPSTSRTARSSRPWSGRWSRRAPRPPGRRRASPRPRHVRGHGLGDRRVGRAQAGRAGHEPDLSATPWRISSRRAPARCSAAWSRSCATPPASGRCRAAAPTRWSRPLRQAAVGGVVDVRFVGHATTVLDLGGVRIATDPMLRTSLGPLERHGAHAGRRAGSTASTPSSSRTATRTTSIRARSRRSVGGRP